WSVAGRMAVAWVTTVPAAATVGALCFWLGHLIGDVYGAITIFAILVAASAYMYWRAQQNKVDHNNVTDDWEDGSGTTVPAGEEPATRPASV
nr:inorganic phosphate transporter [Gordonia sp. (in: high G+C Gram-positive bacteria)]